MFLINIYPNCSIFPNDLPLEYPPLSALGLTSTKSIPQPQVCSPLAGKFLILATFPGPVLWYQTDQESKERARTQEETKLLPFPSRCFSSDGKSQFWHLHTIPKVLPDGSWWKMGDPCSAPELGARTCTEGGAGDNANTQKRELELPCKGSVQWVWAGGKTQMVLVQK